jgi:hypothetical protein
VGVVHEKAITAYAQCFSTTVGIEHSRTLFIQREIACACIEKAREEEHGSLVVVHLFFHSYT